MPDGIRPTRASCETERVYCLAEAEPEAAGDGAFARVRRRTSILLTYRRGVRDRESGGVLRSWLYKLAGIFISILFVYLAVRRVDLSESLQILGSASLVTLAAATLVYLAAYPLRALRWRRILRAQKALSVRQVMVPVFVGYMANNLLPARAGELYRAHFLGRRARMSRSGAVASIVVERAFDGLMLVFVVSLVFLLFPQNALLGLATLVTMLAFLVLAAGVALYTLAAHRTHGLVDRGLSLLPASIERLIGERLRVFLQGIRAVSTLGEVLKVGAYTLCVWALEVCAYSLVMIAFDISLPLGGFLLVYALAALGTALPSGPGYVGPFQYAFILSLGVFDISRETALAVSVAAQISLLGSVTLIGIVLLWREQLRSRPLAQLDLSEDEIK